MTEFQNIFVHPDQVYIVNNMDALPDYLRSSLVNAYDRVDDIHQVLVGEIRSIVLYDIDTVITWSRINDSTMINFSMANGDVSFTQYYDISDIHYVYDYIRMLEMYKFGKGKYEIRKLSWPRLMLPEGFFGRDFLMSFDRQDATVTLSTDNKADYLELILML